MTAHREPCSECEIAYINGVRCHETGCPSAWRDRVTHCFECGFVFLPVTRFQRVCSDCLTPEEDTCYE